MSESKLMKCGQICRCVSTAMPRPLTSFFARRTESRDDLERIRFSDRVYDIGMLMAELKHHFGWRVLQADAAEPFIGHFIRTYSEGFSEPESFFNAITYRSRFYMALGELRIARNKWLPWEHRKWLTDEAFQCLRR